MTIEKNHSDQLQLQTSIAPVFEALLRHNGPAEDRLQLPRGAGSLAPSQKPEIINVLDATMSLAKPDVKCLSEAGTNSSNDFQTVQTLSIAQDQPISIEKSTFQLELTRSRQCHPLMPVLVPWAPKLEESYFT